MDVDRYLERIGCEGPRGLEVDGGEVRGLLV